MKIKCFKWSYVYYFVAILIGIVAVYDYKYLLILGLLCCLGWLMITRWDFAVYLLVLYLPFQIALNMSTNVDLASGRVLILIYFIFWLIKSFTQKRVIVNFSLQTILLGVFFIIMLFSGIYAEEWDWCLRKILVWLSILPLYLFLTSFIKKSHIKHLGYVLGLGGLLMSSIGIIQFIAQFIWDIDTVLDTCKSVAPFFLGNNLSALVVANHSWLVNIAGVTVMRLFAILPDPHIFAFYAGLVGPVSVAMLLWQKRTNSCKQTICFWVLVAMSIIIALVLTFSRGGYLGLLGGALVMLCLLWRFFTKQEKGWVYLLMSWFILLGTLMHSYVAIRFLSIFNIQEGSNVERFQNWQQGLDILRDNYLTGVGVGNYSYYLNSTLSYRNSIYAHNLYLDLGAELGVVGLVVWLLLVLCTIVQLWRVVRYSSDQFLVILSAGLIGSLVCFSIHSIFDNALFVPQILSMLLVILALAVLVIKQARI